MSTVIVRPIDSNEDVLKILHIAEQFHYELQWPYTFSIPRSVERIQSYRYSNDGDILIAEKDGEALGAAEVEYGYEYSEERVGHLAKFYISPNARKTSAGRKLLLACHEWFDSKDCVTAFITPAANIPHLKGHLDNMLIRLGWEICANTLVRSKDVKSKEGIQERGSVPRLGSDQ